MQPFETREKLILAGLYLSKYDLTGVRKLGFRSFQEAYNVIGYALGARPASIKNYRDEFDPLISTRRKGWHKRPIREYCLEVFEKYRSLDFGPFSFLIGSFIGYDEAAMPEAAETDETASAFAKRLITGLAAEQYFEAHQTELSQFRDYTAENTTRYGCGYDFKLTQGSDSPRFLAVEVKGLRDRTGVISLTPKEFDAATVLRDRFFLFVVKNFREIPCHEVFQDPLSSRLSFAKSERVITQVTWTTLL